VGPISTVGGIMEIARQAAAAEGVPWNASIVATLLSKESGGGQNLPPHNYGGILDPAGPFQVIGSTFAANAAPGHGDRMNPVDNALAAFHYIKGRYGTLDHLASSTGLLGAGYKGYGRGGEVAWGGWNARGGDFRTKGPTLFGAGEGGKSERVRITPAGGKSDATYHIVVNINHPNLSSSTAVDELKREVATEIISALDRAGSSGVSDRSLVGS
jgi:SLT domain-containing protein